MIETGLACCTLHVAREVESHDVGVAHVGWAERDTRHRVSTPFELKLCR